MGRVAAPILRAMLITIATVSTVLWLLAMATGHTLGGAIHIFIVMASVAVLERVLQGRTHA